MVVNEIEGKGSVNRPEDETKTSRRFKALCGQKTWFKTKKGTKNVPPSHVFKRKFTDVISTFTSLKKYINIFYLIEPSCSY